MSASEIYCLTTTGSALRVIFSVQIYSKIEVTDSGSMNKSRVKNDTELFFSIGFERMMLKNSFLYRFEMSKNTSSLISSCAVSVIF